MFDIGRLRGLDVFYVLVPILSRNELLAGFVLGSIFFRNAQRIAREHQLLFPDWFPEGILTDYRQMFAIGPWFLVDLEETKTKKWIPGDDSQFGGIF